MCDPEVGCYGFIHEDCNAACSQEEAADVAVDGLVVEVVIHRGP